MKRLLLHVTACALWCAATAVAQQNPNSELQFHREVKMTLKSAVPNLIVSDVARSQQFYRDVLEFETSQTVPPDKGPYVFVDMKRGGVELFLNGRPSEGPLAKGPLAGGMSLYIAVEGVDSLAQKIESGGNKLAIALHNEFYGMREFAITDPDGYLLIFAEPVKK